MHSCYICHAQIKYPDGIRRYKRIYHTACYERASKLTYEQLATLVAAR